MKWLFLIAILCVATHAVAGSFDYERFSRYLVNHDYENARLMLDKMDKSTNMYIRNKGIYFHAKYEAGPAVFYLKQAFDNNIRDDEVLIKLAEAFMWMKNFRDGVALLGMVENKNSLDYKRTRAIYYELQSDLPRALELYSEVIKFEELPYGTMERKANVLSWMRRLDEAIVIYDEIISSDVVNRPLRLRATVSKARTLSWQGNFNLAMSILANVIRVDQNNVDARLVKGQILEWQGEYRKARDVYRDIVQIEPSNMEAKVKLKELMWVR